jgi:hypothetical protein
MSFALSGKYGVGPFILFLRRRYGGSCGPGLASPVRRGRLDAPDIPGLFQRDSHQPVYAFRSQRNAVSHASRSARSSRKFIEQNRQPRFQRLGEAHAASLCVYHQSMAVLAEWNGRIKAGEAKRDLSPNSRATPFRFKRFRTRAHIRTIFDCTSRNNLRLQATTQS